jgi:hypothetical protein
MHHVFYSTQSKVETKQNATKTREYRNTEDRENNDRVRYYYDDDPYASNDAIRMPLFSSFTSSFNH